MSRRSATTAEASGTAPAPLGLGLPLWVAGNDHARRARRRLGDAEDAHPLVHRPLECVGVEEAVDQQRPEEVTDACAELSNAR
jgi:hypothetical protein